MSTAAVFPDRNGHNDNLDEEKEKELKQKLKDKEDLLKEDYIQEIKNLTKIIFF